MGSPKDDSIHIPKTHQKKKLYRAECRQLARDGKMPGPDGVWRSRSGMADNSMKRDFQPTEGK